ncbi:tRNA glutamyl-Q(34) synthetase GluQRS [Corallincola luteus]|uniref:Glutamyl-Q tRNA(Asp) synthetase n=1 Tax=Corallincola luteus TaxID=1775177 RepID=A0ABY2APC4_9GAMM|nr:tRNA glutamyl-Q(34) synthetase GluQRS [Corallincola luteus]TCI04764.1 tRNA glutamyl-Q(34) synthetase GluQRS [Corallincola luteus]
MSDNAESQPLIKTAAPYRGRFAPSPSGPLHFGSLVAAVGSYMQARANRGQWLVRIENIDPPREMPGATDIILRQLELFGLHWDESLLYQSDRSQAYDETLQRLADAGLSYHCNCTRKSIMARGGYYSGHCRKRDLGPDNTALRFVNHHPVAEFDDQLQGKIILPSDFANEDFIIRRRDGLYAYQLAVVVDDIDTGITEVVRGADLITPTGRQIAFFNALGSTAPDYLHLPLATHADGHKLSKQTHAPALREDQRVLELIDALKFLGQKVPNECQDGSVDEVLQWGVAHWQLDRVAKCEKIAID